MTELKPCPFCGGEAEFVLESFFVGRIKCKKCKASQSLLKTEETAIKAWNTRTQTPRTDIKQIKDEAIKEFADDLRTKTIIAGTTIEGLTFLHHIELIDTVVKELTEGGVDNA